MPITGSLFVMSDRDDEYAVIVQFINQRVRKVIEDGVAVPTVFLSVHQRICENAIARPHNIGFKACAEVRSQTVVKIGCILDFCPRIAVDFDNGNEFNPPEGV